MNRRVPGRMVWIVGLLVALLLAGFGSYYASEHPDGLEYVGATTGFADTAKESLTAGSPLADYQARGVSDARASGGLAGIAGVLVVLGLSTGLFMILRRRRAGDGAAAPSSCAPPSARE